TKGLRFELNKEYNDYNITVPFLSKSDEFIATIIIEESVRNKPYVALRSPEKFKKTYKEVKGKQKTNSQSLFDNNLYEKNDDIDKTAILDKNELAKASYNNKHGNKGIKTFMPKKIILAVIGILIFVYIGILEMEKIKDGSGKIDTIDKAISTQNQQNSTESSSATPSDNNKNKVNKQVQVEEKTQNKVNTSSAVEDNTSVQEETKTVKENNTTEASKENENIKANNNASTDMNTTTNSNNNTNTEEKQSTSKPRDDEKNNTSKNNSNSKDQNSNVKNNTDSKSTDTTNKVQ
ncbi:MAG TPA: hypothetical protein DG753_07895, partial [Clostridium sp.]|nr:hypothetical protein [Clostridium sp.]